MCISKNSPKIYYFFTKRDNWIYVYIYTKCNDNFKFTVSLNPMRSSLLHECPQTPVYFLELVFFTIDRKSS